MALELRQNLKLSQQLIMTPQLQMAIKLLQLNRLELLDTITQELQENPILEEALETVKDQPVENEVVEDEPMREVTVEEKMNDDIDWNNYLDEYNSAGKTTYEAEKKAAPDFEAFVAGKETLNKHLLWQLLMTSPTEEDEKIGSVIIGNLTKDGYLDTSIDEIAASSGSSLCKVEKVLDLMQTFDPIGVCARNLEECLLLQAGYLGIDNALVVEIITRHLNHLENKNYKAISKALKISFEKVVEIVNIIKELEPKPGRQFSDEEPHYINPDIFIYKLGDEFIILINDEGIPKLRINSYYKKAIARGGKINGETKSYIQEKIRSAAWLIKSVQQRQKTIYRVTESILKFQKEFFEKGITCLKPMVLKDVAQEIGMHESTISRVTTNKYVHTPQGIFELKYFFNSSINQIEGGGIASVSVQEKIKQIIDNEDKKKPYSDSKIVKFLEESNINIARRTVAKYRDVLHLLPSSKRKNF